MNFDEMLETWRAQDTSPPYDVNRDALRQALDTEEARVRRELRVRRRIFGFMWVFGTGMAVWAGSWIAITITNGWPAIYAIASGVSLGMFALAAGAFWVSRGRVLERNFGNTLKEEMRRSLALVDYELLITRRWITPMLGVAAHMVGTGLFVWTVMASQDITDSSGVGWFWFAVVLALSVWVAYKTMRDERRRVMPQLELRQRRLRDLLAALDARE